MKYVGVDIGKNKHAASAVDEAGVCVMTPRFFTQDAGGLASLYGALQDLGERESSIIGMEATGNYWKVVRHALVERGYRVDVINPLITSREASADVRGRKSDKLDAIAIANVLRKGGYNSAPVEEASNALLKSLTRFRHVLVEQRTGAKQRLISALDVAFPEAAGVLGDLFGAAALSVIKAFPSARLAADANIRTLTSLFAKNSNNTLGREKALAYREAARNSPARTTHTDGEEFVIAMIVDQIRSLDAQLDKVEQRIKDQSAPYSL